MVRTHLRDLASFSHFVLDRREDLLLQVNGTKMTSPHTVTFTT
jgi:hypothetical protein